MMKRVLVTTSRDDVRRVLDQIPFSASYIGRADTRRVTYHYTASTGSGRVELARVTYNYSTQAYTVRLPQ